MQPGKTLALLGGDVRLDGGGSLQAPGGRVELGGVAGAGTVGLNVDGNNLSLSFPDDVARADISLTNGAFVDVTAGGGGSIAVNARNLDVSGKSLLSAGIGTDLGAVDIQAGDITLNATGTITAGQSSRIENNVNRDTTGDSGNINVTAGSLSVTDGAGLVASTFGQGNAGSVNIHAGSTVSFDGVGSNGSSRALSTVESEAVGKGGNVNIQTGSLSVSNGARLNASSEGNGAAGNIEVSASSIRLNNQAFLISNTTAGQGNINLRSQDLVLRRGSNIITNATGTATGGNITIDTGVIAALSDSDISANAQEARGGRVRIDAQGIFGTEFRNQDTPESDITATSALGLEFSGTVEINTPDVDPSRGLVDLPSVPIDTEVPQACTPSGSQQQSKFVITGRGGLPPSPSEALSSDAIQVDWVTLNPRGESHFSPAVSTNQTAPAPAPIVEAQGWVIGDNGEVVLTASSVPVLPHSSWQTPADCNGS